MGTLKIVYEALCQALRPSQLFSKEETVSFHGQELAKSDYDALEQIARQYFNKRAEEYFQKSEFTEVCIENKRVVKLRLWNFDLKRIPEQIQKLTQLQYLDLGNSNISKIENLEQLTELQELILWGNKIRKIENLEHQIKLKNLVLGMNDIRKIENLDQLTQLKELYLMMNDIRKIENLDQLTQLQNLYLDNNGISKIENLEQLTQLQKLDLGKNNIKKIENLEQQKQLKEIDIMENLIREDDPEITELINRGIKMFVNKRPDLMEFLDIQVTKEFQLEDLKDSYDPKELVPEDISQKIAKAYNYIRTDEKLGEQYLKQSVLGKKISGIISQDYNFIFGFIRQIEKGVNLRNKKWKDELKKYLESIEDAKVREEKKTVADKCLERIKKYPAPKDMLDVWKNE